MDYLNVKDFGAKIDGVTDDSDAIQSAINKMSNPFATGAIYLPCGYYNIKKPLIYRGDYAFGLRIMGGGSAAGLSGTVLVYQGPPGKDVLELSGCTSTAVEHLAINCNNLARSGINITHDDIAKKGTSGVFIDRVAIAGGVGKMGSAIMTGYNDDGTLNNSQCDRIVISNCLFTGWGSWGTSSYGFLAGWANCKNFAVRDTSFVGFGTGIKFGGSGFMIIDGFVGGGSTLSDIEAATGNMEIRAGNSEHSARLLKGTTGLNPGTVSISNWSWDSSTVAEPFISYQGHLRLIGNDFRDSNQPGRSVPLVQLYGCTYSLATLVSEGNYYQNAGELVPVVDDLNQYIKGSKNIRSFGDYCFDKEGNVSRLKMHP